MKYVAQLFLLSFFLMGFTLEIRASVPDSRAFSRSKIANPDCAEKSIEITKPGLFKQFRAIKTLKKQMRMLASEGESPSKLARLAVIVFGVSLALLAFSSAIPAISIVSLAGFVASNIMAMIVLYRKDNLRSRKMARTILIASLVLIIISLLLALFFLLFLIALFG